MIRPARVPLLAACAALLVACAEPASRPAPPPADSTLPKTGVVGLVSEVKERGMTRDNWRESVRSLFANETDGNVRSIRYEVTVFYDDGTSGVVAVDRKPALKPGDRVRVLGTRIEALRR